MTYGFMTHSFLRSTEHRKMVKERREFTKRYLAGEIRFDCPPLPVACPCDYRPWPHLGHSELRDEEEKAAKRHPQREWQERRPRVI